jgi:hypothetical protein
MNITGIRISPTSIANAVTTNSLADAEAKLRKVEETLRQASKDWETFTGGKEANAVNAGRSLSQTELTKLIIGVYKLVRGTAAVLSAEHAAMTAVLQSVKSVNMKP